MSYCPKCGIKLPEDEGARFCPNCGAPVSRVTKPRAAKISWTGSLLSRIMVFLAMFFLCIIVTFIGALASVERSEANRIMQEVDEMEKAMKLAGAPIIFGNNLMHTLIMFVPIAGPCWGIYVLYNTGRVFAAYSVLYNMNPIFLFSTVLVLPFALMEYLSYALAVSESLWMIYAALKRNLKNEIIAASITIVVCNIILLLAALIEAAMISLA